VSAQNDISNRATQAETVAASLAAYLESLPNTEWDRPSDCAGWTVANVAAHLVLVEALLGGSIRRGLGGDVSPMPQATGRPDAWREYRAREIARLSALPRAELVDQFRSGLDAMREPLEELAAADPHPGGGWHPTAGVRPLAWFAGQWLVEIALHDWDIRVSGDPAADVNGAAWPSLGPEMRDRMPQCYQPAQTAQLSGTVLIDLGGPAPVRWLARISAGKLEIVDDGRAPDATIRTDPGAYALAQTRRRAANLFEERGRWRLTGNRAMADQLAAAFSGY